ncbi:hypothetical protein ACQPXS_45625 [Streptomyces sp. CA-142005]|uniref:hypothetical protein n=1 Tax=Streptomyces sp. CA-142005 TaxID=3240052 RepID=UPI003D8E4271
MRHYSGGSGFWSGLGVGASLGGALGAGISFVEEGGWVLAAGYSSCNVTTTPPPPPPPTAKTGLRQNPGTRPSGQPHGSESPHQNGTKGPGTGPSDTKPLNPKGPAPTQVTAPAAYQPTSNGTGLDNSGGCSGALLGFQCNGNGNLLDPDTVARGGRQVRDALPGGRRLW